MAKRQHSFGRFIALTILCLASGLSHQANASALPGFDIPTYTITDLGVLNGHDESRALAINEDGIAVGVSSDSATFASQPVILLDGELIALAPVGEGQAWASDINDDGIVVGWLGDSSGFGGQAFIWFEGELTIWSASEDDRSSASGINNAGLIVGKSTYESGNIVQQAAIWETDGARVLGALDEGAASEARDINETGQIVGYSETEAGSDFTDEHAFLWENETWTDLGVIGGEYSRAFAINDGGSIVGMTTTDDDQYLFSPGMHAFLWKDGEFTDLGTLPGGEVSLATDINSDGVIVGDSMVVPGDSYGEPNEEHACIWLYGQIIDLNTLIPEDSGWVLEYGSGINDAGQIVGAGQIDGERHGFLLTPIEE